MHTASRRSAIRVAGILAIMMFAPVMAAPPGRAQEREPVEFSFRYSRAELTTAPGAERLYQRLVRQAGQACSLPRTGSPGLRYRDSTCVAELVEKTVRRIDVALLTSRWLRGAPGQLPEPMALR